MRIPLFSWAVLFSFDHSQAESFFVKEKLQDHNCHDKEAPK